MTNQETLTLAQYAQVYGLSEKTVRRRIKSGKLTAKTVQGKFGPEYRIIHTYNRGEKTNNSDGQGPPLLQTILTLTDQVRDLSFLVGELRAKNEILERKLLSVSTRKRKHKPWYKRLLRA